MLTTSRPRCPKCAGQLFAEQDMQSGLRLPPEWTCLQCGWRQTWSPRQFTRAFGLSASPERAAAA
jgi:hypothetical protein